MLNLEEPLATLGALLARRGIEFEAYAIGAGALSLVGLVARPTRDLDLAGVVSGTRVVRTDELPKSVSEAVQDTARLHGLQQEWMNLGPRTLLDFGLPDGALERATVRRWGGLTLHLASRIDQIAFKLYAAIDQGPRSRHFQDLQDLRPTAGELRRASDWARTHDTSEGFAEELRRALRDLGVGDAEA